jgi:hypothetical protein
VGIYDPGRGRQYGCFAVDSGFDRVNGGCGQRNQISDSVACGPFGDRAESGELGVVRGDQQLADAAVRHLAFSAIGI